MTSDLMNKKMIFVVGNSRSGTSMMSRVLKNHAKIFTFNELHFFEQLWNPSSPAKLDREHQARLAARLLTIQRDGYLTPGEASAYLAEAAGIVAGLPEQTSPAEVYAAFVLYESARGGKEIPCDQTPRNAFFLKEILALYPNAYIINMIRDPRDVILSQKNKWRRRFLVQNRHIPWFESARTWTNYHPVTMGMLWNANINAAMAYQQHPRVFQMRFEQFIEAPEAELKRLMDWLGMDYSLDMLLVPQIGSSHSQDHPENLGIKREVAGRWQSTDARDRVDLVICQQICRKNIQDLGYSLVPIQANFLQVGLAYLLWPVKAVGATVFNVGRSRNIFQSVLRRLRPIFSKKSV